MLPKKIKVGWRNYAVKEIENLTEGEEKLNGIITYQDQQIRIEKELPLRNKWVTLIHELLHGIDYITGQDMDEGKIQAMAEAVMSMLCDNKELLKGMYEDLSR